MPHIGPTRYALGRSGWLIAALVGMRLGVPLLVLAGVGVPGAPTFTYDGLTGDATGFYAASREIVASWGRLPVALVAVVAGAGAAWSAGLVVAWRRRRSRRPWVVAGAAALVAALACIAITQMNAAGAGVVGWPLVWALPLLPYRAASPALDQDGAYAIAVALSLAANATTVVATAYAGLYATGRRAVGVGAAAVLALWPLITGPVVGERAWANGTWAVDTGLAAYNEPLSTALVTVALALVLASPANDVRLVIAGAALGLAATVKLSNGLLAVVALVLVAVRIGPRRAAPFAAAGAAFLLVVALYWPKGYSAILEEDPDAWPDALFALEHAGSAWSESLLFTPLVLFLLVPLAVLGAVGVGDAWRRSVLVSWALVNPLVYSFYWFTPLHPRLLFASLPAVFVLWFIGAAWIASALRVRAGSACSSCS